MERDKFIKNLIKLGAFGVSNLVANRVLGGAISAELDKDNDNILVLIQLIGGNDGLNTVIPINHWDQLEFHRGNVLPNKKDIIKANDKIGFHPSASSFHSLIQQQKMCIINSVGYENPNRSHFRSMDIWSTASPSNQYWTSGWLGRYFDTIHPSYPIAYPNSKYPHPLVVSLGNDVAETCQGKVHQFSYALSDFIQLTEQLPEQHKNINNVFGNYGDLIEFLSQGSKLTNSLSKALLKIQQTGKNNVRYPESELAKQLSMVAQLINGGSKTKVFTLTLGGFDTHAYQVDKYNSNEGNHSNLLKILGDAVTLFLEDLKISGNNKRVIGMIYSEFGRQIKSNESLGTDHGDAAPVFLFGEGLKKQFIGDLPEIPDSIPNQAGVPMKIDFKEVYYEILNGWFKLDPNGMNNIFLNDKIGSRLKIF